MNGHLKQDYSKLRVIFQGKSNPYLSPKINVSSISEWVFVHFMVNYSIKWPFYPISPVTCSVEPAQSSQPLLNGHPPFPVGDHSIQVPLHF